METKEMFVDIIMDLLIIAGLDGVGKDEEKENRMRSELLKMNDEELNSNYKKANELVELIYKNERTDSLLKEIDEIGVEAVRIKYGLNKVKED